MKPEVKRASDFSESHEYDVKFKDGIVYKIFRDNQQFSYSIWYIRNLSDASRQGTYAFAGFTKKESVDRCIELHDSKTFPNSKY